MTNLQFIKLVEFVPPLLLEQPKPPKPPTPTPPDQLPPDPQAPEPLPPDLIPVPKLPDERKATNRREGYVGS